MTLHGKLWKGVLIAPLVPAAVIAIPLAFQNFSASMWVILFAVPFSYIGTFLLGLPLIKLLDALGKLTVCYLALGGVALGAFVFYIFSNFFQYLMGTEIDWTPKIGGLVAGGALGFAVAASLGVLAGYPLLRPQAH